MPLPQMYALCGYVSRSELSPYRAKWFYVSKVKGDGGKDWEWTTDRKKALALTPYWQSRFAADARALSWPGWFCSPTGKAFEPPTWHVVTSQGGFVLGVFGEALLSQAQECARGVEHQTGLPTYVIQHIGIRPAVGSKLDVQSECSICRSRHGSEVVHACE